MINPQELSPEEELFLKQWANKTREEQEEYALKLFRSNLKLTDLAFRQHQSIYQKQALIESLQRLRDQPKRKPLTLPDLGEK